MNILAESLRAGSKRVRGCILVSLVAVLACGILHARMVSVPPRSASTFLDTEVSN